MRKNEPRGGLPCVAADDDHAFPRGRGHDMILRMYVLHGTLQGSKTIKRGVQQRGGPL